MRCTRQGATIVCPPYRVRDHVQILFFSRATSIIPVMIDSCCVLFLGFQCRIKAFHFLPFECVSDADADSYTVGRQGDDASDVGGDPSPEFEAGHMLAADVTVGFGRTTRGRPPGPVRGTCHEGRS